MRHHTHYQGLLIGLVSQVFLVIRTHQADVSDTCSFTYFDTVLNMERLTHTATPVWLQRVIHIMMLTHAYMVYVPHPTL